MLIPVLVLILAILFPVAADAQIQPAARQYQRELIRAARHVWGLEAPIATFGAQIHQESAWRPAARSPYADGLAQFTPATADWISGVYAAELGPAQPFNPTWALRALVRYDRHLWQANHGATACDRWAFTLAAYNGGQGWINRDRRLAAANGADPERWWKNVELYSPRARWAFEENRGYPRRILLVLQPAYSGWGPGVACGGLDDVR